MEVFIQGRLSGPFVVSLENHSNETTRVHVEEEEEERVSTWTAPSPSRFLIPLPNPTPPALRPRLRY